MDSLLVLMVIGPPLVAGLAVALFGRALGEKCARIGIGALWISAISSLVLLTTVMGGETLRWSVQAGLFSLSVVADRLGAVMMTLISLVSLIIHVYSARYMTGDPGYQRFFMLLGILTFVLLGLVTSGSLLWMFGFWHLVSWMLAALLSFNQASKAARGAGRRTLWIQGFGDLAFALGAAILYLGYGTLDLRELFDRVGTSSALTTGPNGLGPEFDAVSWSTLCFLVSVMTKSAQFPFHIWLPGTIEAPTPVSALLHAGIVNAGGFLVNRLAPLFGAAPTTLHLMFLVGAATALVGAAAMLTQSSVKRTLVYSTMGQMGYMVMECGLGAFALAVFHLCAHGLFKATLFLNSGANIHKARAEFKLPPTGKPLEGRSFSLATWATGLAVTLLLPLIILLAAHGVVAIPLLDAQGAVIFLFFGWVTSSQAMFSLYRAPSVTSWKVSATMLGALALIGLTYLWAGEAFTHLLYPGPEEAAHYFRAAEWPRGVFDAFVGLSAVFVVGVWVVIYGKAHGVRFLMPLWVENLRTRAYVAFLNGLYVEDAVRALSGSSRRATTGR